MVAGAPLTRWATVVAALMLAHQVAAKAVRDSFFLQVFPVTSLPMMVIGAAAVSVAAVPFYARLLARFGPDRVVPAGFLLSAAVHVVEWSRPDLTPGVAVIIYLHLAAFGALLLSGFWSLASEVFDPITARRSYGQIAAAGTLGGVAGGLAAERLATLLPYASHLLLLAGLHAACAALVFGRTRHERPIEPASGASAALGLDSFRRAPYLKPLALLVLLGTASASILDYLFKSAAAAQFDGAGLLRFFAIFYVVTQTSTFVVQTVFTARALRRGGAGDTVSALPVSVGLGSVAALFIPALPLFALARGLESVIRGSLFRSGYELLFSPMGPTEKRRAKTFLDVACDRAGDALGAGLVQLALAVIPLFLVSGLLGVVLCMALVSFAIGRRLNAYYARQVERRLVDHAEAIVDDVDATGWASRPSTLAPVVASYTPGARAAAPLELDESTALLATLRSGNRNAVARALAETEHFDTALVAHVVTLLAWNDVRAEAHRVLVACGDRHVGLYVDYLLTPETAFAIRRRLPRVLGHLPSQRTVDGLLDGLDDGRFEVRYRCSRALDQVLQHAPTLTVDPARIYKAVERELAVPQSVARSYKVIDQDDAADPAAAFDPDAQASRNVDYMFSLLSTVLPRDPLKAAYRAVHSDDRLLRGLALDYLDGVLPEDLRPSFWAILDVDGRHVRTGDPNEAMAQLVRSQEGANVRPSASDAPGQSAPPPAAKPPSDPR